MILKIITIIATKTKFISVQNQKDTLFCPCWISSS